MRKFAETYPDSVIVQQVAAQLPWWHNVVLLDKVKSNEGNVVLLCLLVTGADAIFTISSYATKHYAVVKLMTFKIFHEKSNTHKHNSL